MKRGHKFVLPLAIVFVVIVILGVLYFAFNLTGNVTNQENLDSNTKSTTYIHAGTLLASKTNNDPTNYYVQDHLGSNLKVIDGNVVEQDNKYYAFGETETLVDNGNSNNYKYTGKELDEETGLYYYGARYYDPEVGRFMAADAITGNLDDPLSLNRYAYVDNNPLKYVDPTGNSRTDEQMYGEKGKGDTVAFARAFKATALTTTAVVGTAIVFGPLATSIWGAYAAGGTTGVALNPQVWNEGAALVEGVINPNPTSAMPEIITKKALGRFDFRIESCVKKLKPGIQSSHHVSIPTTEGIYNVIYNLRTSENKKILTATLEIIQLNNARWDSNAGGKRGGNILYDWKRQVETIAKEEKFNSLNIIGKGVLNEKIKKGLIKHGFKPIKNSDPVFPEFILEQKITK